MLILVGPQFKNHCSRRGKVNVFLEIEGCDLALETSRTCLYNPLPLTPQEGIELKEYFIFISTHRENILQYN